MDSIEGKALDKGDMCICPGSIIPPARRSAIFEALLAGLKVSPTMVVVDQSEDGLVLVGVAAVDWPGLSSIVLGELHHYGWNLDVLEGFAVEDDGPRRGFVITGIHELEPERRLRFAADASRMADLLSRLALGSAGTVSLLSRAAERLEKFEEVRQELEKLYEHGPVPPGILGEKGELVLFISSRSDEYLSERKAFDLAWIVQANFQLVNEVRSSGGTSKFRMRNLRTTREHLTGINIAGFERDISFQGCVTALTHAWSGATIRHQRRYTTRDGIICIRIEMTGPAGMSATRVEQAVIRRTLSRLLVSHELERLERIHRYGGGEHYARALIPLLLEECGSTGMSQAYIAMVSSTTFEAQLKLVLVTVQPDSETHDRNIIDLVGHVNANAGLSVTSFKSPSNYDMKWVDILNIAVRKEDYAELEGAFRDVKRAIESSFGKFRDFDRGMRLNDVRQLTEIRAKLDDLPDNLITDFYYRIEDFLRASAEVDELAAHIRLAFDAITAYNESAGRISGPHVKDVFAGSRKLATLVCCVVRGKEQVSFESFLETVRHFTVNASLIDWSGVSAMLLRIQDKGHGLDEASTEDVLGKLRLHCPSASHGTS